MAPSRSWAGALSSLRSSSSIEPASGDSSPAINRRAVVFPEPDGPTSTNSSRGATVNESSRTAITRAPRVVTKAFERFLTVKPGIAESLKAEFELSSDDFRGHALVLLLPTRPVIALGDLSGAV